MILILTATALPVGLLGAALATLRHERNRD